MRRYAALLLLLMGMPVAAMADEPTVSKPEGFRELKWGMTREDAQNLYPDLRERGGSPGDKILIRVNATREENKAAGVVFREIRYHFSYGVFFKVTASTSISRYSGMEVHTSLLKNIEAKYGPPRQSDKGKDTTRTVWYLDGAKVEVLYAQREHALDGDITLEIENVKTAAKKLDF